MDRSDYRNERRKFAERSIGELIDMLSANDLRTRFLAEICLRDATST